MIIKFGGAGDMDIEAAERYITERSTPAVLLDDRFIIRAKNAACAKQAPEIRRGACIKKYISDDDFCVLHGMKPGEIRSLGSPTRFAYGLSAIRGKGNTVVVFNAVSSEVRSGVSGLYSRLAGYDLRIFECSGRESGSERHSGERLLFERIQRRLINIMGILVGGVNPDEMRPFNAADTLRGVITAAEEYISSIGYRLTGIELPKEAIVPGSEHAFVSILAAAVSCCARFSSDGGIRFSGRFEDGTAEFRVSARVGFDAAWLNRAIKLKSLNGALLSDGDGIAMDVYLMRLLANGNFWEVDYSCTPDEGGMSLFSLILRCPISSTSALPANRFVLSDSVNLFIVGVVRAELSAIRQLHSFKSCGLHVPQ